MAFCYKTLFVRGDKDDTLGTSLFGVSGMVSGMLRLVGWRRAWGDWVGVQVGNESAQKRTVNSLCISFNLTTTTGLVYCMVWS